MAEFLGRGRRRSVEQDAAVESRGQLHARRVPVDPINRRSGIQERGVPIFEPIGHGTKLIRRYP